MGSGERCALGQMVFGVVGTDAGEITVILRVVGINQDIKVAGVHQCRPHHITLVLAGFAV